MPYFKVEDKEGEYRVWQHDSLAIRLDNRDKLIQKLNYIHLNPLQEWRGLANTPESHYWSSAKFYANNEDNIGISFKTFCIFRSVSQR